MRADSLATLCFFHPWKKRNPAPGRVPILMYHSISESGNEAQHPYYQTHTSPLAFDTQMRYLRERGYTAVSLQQAQSYMRTPELGPAKPVVITFDDGFLDFYTHAVPAMTRYGFQATMYLPTSFVGAKFAGTSCMSWDQVRELERAGMMFGSHTVTHPQLRSVNAEQLRSELYDSKQAIEDELGHSVDSFAYPYAFPEADRAFAEGLSQILRDAGYRNGVSTILGTAGPGDNVYFLPRLPVNSHDDEQLLQAKLDGGYDWLHTLQRVSKWMKRVRR